MSIVTATTQLYGVSELVTMLRAYGRDVSEELPDALQTVMQTNIKDVTPVKTGALKASVKVTHGKFNQEYIKFTIDMLFYGKLINDGTARIKPRLFVNKGVDKTQAQLNEISSKVASKF